MLDLLFTVEHNTGQKDETFCYVIRFVHTYKGVVCVHSGDGANDVSMIQVADVGVGISGQEGMQVMTSTSILTPPTKTPSACIQEGFSSCCVAWTELYVVQSSPTMCTPYCLICRSC